MALSTRISAARSRGSRTARRLRAALLVSVVAYGLLVPALAPAEARVSADSGSRLSFADYEEHPGNSGDSIEVGDFNGDHDPDLVMTTGVGLDVLLGRAGSGFGPPTEYPFEVSGPYTVAIGDFNADGDPDLVMPSHDPGDMVRVLLGEAGGGFGTQRSYPTGVTTYAVAVGNFDADRDQDLVVGSDDEVVVLTGGPGGSFSAPTAFPSGAGFNGPIAVDDFNSDGDPDLAVSSGFPHGQASVSVLLGAPGATLGPPTDYGTRYYGIRAVAVGDFNEDGDPDVAVSNVGRAGRVLVMFGAAGGTFAPLTYFGTGRYTAGLAVADFDGDGHADLAVASYANQDDASGRVLVLLGDGGGRFGVPFGFAVGQDPFSVAVGDFDGDADLDVATPGHYSDSYSVLLNTSGEVVACRGREASIVGTDGPDSLVGTGGDDVVALLHGDDTFAAAGGDDLVCGGIGTDTIDGDEGADLIRGGADDDTLRGDAGDDVVYGQRGDDALHGGAGADDTCHGGPDTDTADTDCESVDKVP